MAGAHGYSPLLLLGSQCIRKVTAKSENIEKCLGSLQIKGKKGN